MSHIYNFFNWAPMFRATGKSCKLPVTLIILKMWHLPHMTEEA